MIRVVFTLIFCFLSLNSERPALAVSKVSDIPLDLMKIREQTRQVLRTSHCASCHTPGLSTTREEALHVYNLDHGYWSSTLSDSQLRDLQRRLKSPLTHPELKAMGGSGTERPLSKQQLRLVDDFFKREFENRRIDPVGRFRELQQAKYPHFFKVMDKK